MNVDEIEIHSGKPDFAFTPIRRLEAKVEAVTNFAPAPSLSEGNGKLRELASKVGADAVIEVEYKNGISMTSWRAMTITGLAVKKISDERACPHCAETIKRAAVKCRFCGEPLEPESETASDIAVSPSDVQETLRGTNNPTTVYWIATAVVVALLIIIIIGNS